VRFRRYSKFEIQYSQSRISNFESRIEILSAIRINPVWPCATRGNLYSSSTPPSLAISAGDILAHLRAKGRPIDVEDVLIGATALLKGLTVVTNNIKHFRQIPNLKVEDWLT
jgi:hypothetical protein